MQKPILTIDNPKAITPGGAYHLEGFEPEVIGSRNQLKQNFRVGFQMNNKSAAGWANFPVAYDFVSKNEKGQDMVYFIGGKYITRHWLLSLSNANFGTILHTIDDDGSSNYCACPGICETEKGNILYTSEQNLGRGFYGFNKGDNFTTKIVDRAGRDLSSLNGLVVHNLNDGSTATITSISTTTETNDTINFSGGFSDGGDIDNGEGWVVFVDTFQDLNTATYPHFGGQTSYVYWSRPIINFDGDYFIGHGNYIAKLANDESTYDEDYSQLPSMSQLNCMQQIGNNIFIGCTRNGKGLLLVWDGVTASKYQSIIPLNLPVYAIKEYRGGAILYSGSSLYWTDGYSIKRLSDIPGTYGSYAYAIAHSGMAISGKNVFVNGGGGGNAQPKKGVWVYNIEANSWIYNPYEKAAGIKILYGGSGGGMFDISGTATRRIVASYSDGSNSALGLMTADGGQNRLSLAIFSYSAPKNTKINFAELIVGQGMTYIYGDKPAAKITMAISDGKKPFWMYGQSKTDETASNYNEINVDGSSTIMNKAVIGDMVRILNGGSTGEIAFITGISNQGTASEVWTLDKNLTAKITNSELFQIFNCQKMGEHTISDYIKQPLVFPNGLLVNGDFYIFIIIENTGDSFLEVRNISLF